MKRIESFGIDVAHEVICSNESKTGIKIGNSVLIQENLTFTYKKW